MIAPELAKKIRLLQIRTSKIVNEIMAGEYKSAFRGSGVEFDEVREYQPGDDIRSIDWNVTARQGRPYLKRFQEERELTVMLAVDLSASGLFGTRNQAKTELAAELCALLALSAAKSNDKAGLLLFTDRIERFIPPAKGASHAMRLVREILGYQPQGTGTDLAGALEYMGKVLRKRSVVFLISDFIAQDFAKPLRILGRRHDLIAMNVNDPVELSLPDLGLLNFQDAESGETILLDTSSPALRRQFATLANEKQQELTELFRSAGVDNLTLTTGQDYQKKLVHFFRLRERKYR